MDQITYKHIDQIWLTEAASLASQTNDHYYRNFPKLMLYLGKLQLRSFM